MLAWQVIEFFHRGQFHFHHGHETPDIAIKNQSFAVDVDGSNILGIGNDVERFFCQRECVLFTRPVEPAPTTFR